MPIPSSSLPSSFPAAPTKGTPCLSSWKPGASPTNISSAVGEPEPKRAGAGGGGGELAPGRATAAPKGRGERPPAAPTTTATTAAATEGGLSSGAVGCE